MNSAYGMHLSNMFAMSVDESWVANDTFTNVGRKVFFGKVESDHPYWLSVFGYDFDGDGVKVKLYFKESRVRILPVTIILSLKNNFE